MQPATVCYPVVDGEMLLIRKQRGLGAGKLVGAGGKVEPGETPDDCVRREVREELCVGPVGLRKAGELDFHFGDATPDDDSIRGHVYVADGVDGTPRATEEAVPVWHPTDDLPYGEMWADDRVWMPHLLDGRTFRGTFVLARGGDGADGADVDADAAGEERLLSYELDLDVAVGDAAGD